VAVHPQGHVFFEVVLEMPKEGGSVDHRFPLWFPDSMYPLWDRELWDPYAGTHPLCLDGGVTDLFFDEDLVDKQDSGR
jgi:hypothetical protein